MRALNQYLFFPLLMSFIVCAQTSAETQQLRVAITHTTDNSGLMARLNPVFEQQYNVKLNVVIAGSGQALRLGRQGDVDVLLTHAPEDEKQFIAEDFGLSRQPVMSNDYVIVGPATDPAGVRQGNTVMQAFRILSDSDSIFISRGDDSGTHKKELSVIASANIEINDDWYVAAGVGMGATLLLAGEKQAYTLTDRGTWLAFKNRLELEVLYESSAELNNPYHVIAVNPALHEHTNPELAQQYISFLTGATGQQIIADFNIDGQQLFLPNGVEHVAVTGVEKKKRGNFFLDAIVSAFRLIVDFDSSLFFVVWTSLRVSLLAVLIASLISLPLGVVVALNKFRGKTFLLACLNTLMALPTVVVGLLLYGLLNRQGLFGEYSLLYTPVAMVIGQSVLITPVVWNLAIAAVNAADPRLARTCMSLGASFFQRCLIYMSEVRFALIAAIVTGFGRAIGEVGIAMMLGGNIDGYTRTMTTAIALETSKGDFEFALALGFMLLLVAFVVNSALQQFQLRSK